MHSNADQATRDVLPLSDPDRTVALLLTRWSDHPKDPLWVSLDFTLLDQLGWRPGDRLALEPIPLDRRTGEGGLIIRRANRDEPALKLRRDHYRRKPNRYAPNCPDGPDGPRGEWPFPVEWVETFFPREYIPGPGAPVFGIAFRDWLLRDLSDQRGKVVIPLDSSRLEFRLQRTDPAAPVLDLHLPLGVLHLMQWSPRTPLALTSANGFDPAAPEDVLTIRRVAPEAANLRWDGEKFATSPSPAWLERYFPGLHCNSDEFPPAGTIGTAAGADPVNPNLVRFPDPDPLEWYLSFDDERRTTFCVHHRSFKLGPDSLAFTIPETSGIWE